MRHEKQVIEALLARDEGGVELLLKHYGPLLRYVIGPILPTEEDREEVLSETVMKVWNGIESYRAELGSWTAWLTAVARNTALSRARGLHEAEDTLPEDIPSHQLGPEELLLRQERREALAGALEKLSHRDRALFYRKYYYLQSTAQIASELGLTERAVEGRLYRIREKLRGYLGGDGDA